MDRMEILRLAFAGSKNPKEAMELAQQMADFVGNKPKAIIVEKLKLAKDESFARSRRHWTREEAQRLKKMTLAGVSYKHMADTLKRTVGGVRKAIERNIWAWYDAYPESDGQPNEAQEWADFDKDC